MRILLPLLLLVSANIAKAEPPIDNPLSATTFFPSALSWVSSGMMNARGVAQVEQMRDELPDLHADIVAGLAKELSDIRQPALKELFTEVANDQAAMEKIMAAYPAKSELVAITLAMTAELL